MLRTKLAGSATVTGRLGGNMFSPMDIGVMAGIALLVWGPKKFPELNAALHTRNLHSSQLAAKLSVQRQSHNQRHKLFTRANSYRLVVRPAARLAMLSTFFIGAGMVCNVVIQSASWDHTLMPVAVLCIGTTFSVALFCHVFSRAAQYNLDQSWPQLPQQLTYCVSAMIILLYTFREHPDHAGSWLVVSVGMIIILIVMLAILSKFMTGYWALRNDPAFAKAMRRQLGMDN
jgi:hypothetical protein